MTRASNQTAASYATAAAPSPPTIDSNPGGGPVLPSGRIPSLDGLRAVSIAAVLLGHLAGTAGFPTVLGDPIRDNEFINIADLGVRVFFVISGFLITGILMKDSGRTGGISLRRFYLRRSMRIFPAYYVFVGSVVILTMIGVFSVTANDFTRAFTYTTNYDPNRSWEVGHLWSLAVEEQFYLLWPMAIILLGMRNAKAAALLVILTVPLFRAFEYRFIPQWQEIVGNTFETAADALAVGCVLALSIGRLRTTAWFQRMLSSPWIILIVVAVALLMGQWGVTRLLVSMSLMNVAIALSIAYVVVRPTTPIGRFLNVRPLVFIGTLSYSIYLWQQMFVNRNSTLITSTFPFSLILVALVALASYYLVERPFLRWRPRVEERLLGKSTATPAETHPAVREGGEVAVQQPAET